MIQGKNIDNIKKSSADLINGLWDKLVKEKNPTEFEGYLTDLEVNLTQLEKNMTQIVSYLTRFEKFDRRVAFKTKNIDLTKLCLDY